MQALPVRCAVICVRVFQGDSAGVHSNPWFGCAKSWAFSSQKLLQFTS